MKIILLLLLIAVIKSQDFSNADQNTEVTLSEDVNDLLSRYTLQDRKLLEDHFRRIELEALRLKAAFVNVTKKLVSVV